jgi:hypothetical protein
MGEPLSAPLIAGHVADSHPLATLSKYRLQYVTVTNWLVARVY